MFNRQNEASEVSYASGQHPQASTGVLENGPFMTKK